VRYLPETHAFLWAAFQPARLSQRAAQARQTGAGAKSPYCPCTPAMLIAARNCPSIMGIRLIRVELVVEALDYSN